MKKILIAGFCGLAFAAIVMLMTARSSVGEQPGATKPAAVEGAATTATSRAIESAPRHAGKPVAAIPSAAIVFFAPRYGSSPRIVHVMQPDERADMSAGGDAEADATIINDVGNEIVPRRPAFGLRTYERK
jgi:hypothetical protein